jgi:hypothetical protein
MDTLEIARAGADPETDARLGEQINALDINADVLAKERAAQQDTLDAAERKAQFYLCANCGHEFWPRYQAEGEPARCPDCSATQDGTNRLAVEWPNGRTYSVPRHEAAGGGLSSPVPRPARAQAADAAAEAQTTATKTGGAIYTLAEGDGSTGRSPGARQLMKGERAGAGYVVLPQGGPETIDLPINEALTDSDEARTEMADEENPDGRMDALNAAGPLATALGVTDDASVYLAAGAIVQLQQDNDAAGLRRMAAEAKHPRVRELAAEALTGPKFSPQPAEPAAPTPEPGGGSGDDSVTAMLKAMQEQLAQANATLAQLKDEGDALSAELGGKD